MDFTQLQLFKDIVHARSISRGASQNGVTQSAASQSVQELERQLGAKLLDRSRRPLEVTEAGRLLYDVARDVLRRHQEFMNELDALKGNDGGKVRVAAIYSIGMSEMSKLEEEFYRRAPSAQLEVSYLRPEKVYQAVTDEKVDLGLVSYPESTREVVSLAWKQEPMVVACSPSHALAARATVSPAELEHIDFIGFDEDLPISRDIERFLKERRVQVHVTMQFDNIQSMKEALRLGHAISILPAPILRDDEEKGLLRAVPLDEPLYRPLGIIHRRRRSLPRVAKAFLELLRGTAPQEG